MLDTHLPNNAFGHNILSFGDGTASLNYEVRPRRSSLFWRTCQPRFLILICTCKYIYVLYITIYVRTVNRPKKIIWLESCHWLILCPSFILFGILIIISINCYLLIHIVPWHRFYWALVLLCIVHSDTRYQWNTADIIHCIPHMFCLFVMNPYF